MTKCQVRNFVKLYYYICKDILVYDPTLRLDLDRDMSRINSSIVSMGDQVFLKHLPEIGKVLDLSLSSGRLVRSHLPFMKGFKHGSPIPRLFKGIWLRLFTIDGYLKEDIDPNYIFFLRTLLYVGKKFKMDCPKSSLFETTEEFYVTDESLPPPSLDWDGDGFTRSDINDISLRKSFESPAYQQDMFGSLSDSDSELLDTIQRVADHVFSLVGLPSQLTFRHGPGAVADRLQGLGKYLPRRWSPRLESMFPVEGIALPLGHNYHLLEEEIPSRLLAVPKTIKGPRLIAAEPSDHMWCQMSLMDFLYGRTKETWLSRFISFDSQKPSQLLALEGSRNGYLATVDLKSASDRISLWLIERMVRKNPYLLSAFQATRTAYVDLSIDKKLPSLIKMRKFTTQGSALTFPVQSLVFLCISLGVGLHQSNLKVCYKNIKSFTGKVRVFGDDIVVPADWVHNLQTVMERLYLKVNTQKTHSTGFFRESCGVDAYGGFDVTPAYVTQFGDGASPSVATSVIAVSNNFFMKGLWNASQAILSTLPANILALIPVRKTEKSTLPTNLPDIIPVRKATDGSITLTSFSGDRNTPITRWNSDLQREEHLRLIQKVRKKMSSVDGSRHLTAFLAVRDNRDITPSFDGIMPWRPLSRWEALPVVGKGWV